MYLISVLFGRSSTKETNVYEWVSLKGKDGKIVKDDKGQSKKNLEVVGRKRVAILDDYADALKNENRYHEIRHFNASIRWLAIHEASTIVVSAFLILAGFLS